MTGSGWLAAVVIMAAAGFGGGMVLPHTLGKSSTKVRKEPFWRWGFTAANGTAIMHNGPHGTPC